MENMEFIVPLEKWYLENKRDLPWRNTTDPYVIWISEVILQQTRVIQGLDYFNRFMTRFPDVASLAEAEEDEVLKYWQGIIVVRVIYILPLGKLWTILEGFFRKIIGMCSL